MSADINCESFDPKFHVSRLIHLQGRPLLASDLNEHGAIFQYYLRQFIMDFVGKHWRTKGSFEISAVESKTFKISKGHFYVDGILCVNEEVNGEVECLYAPKNVGQNEIVQPMFPTPEWDHINKVDLTNIPFAVYLECWERHTQRPAVREVALGGLDTASRLEIAWQARVLTEGLAKTYIGDITGALNKRKPPPKQDIMTAINDKLKKFEMGLKNQGAEPCTGTQDLLEILDDASPTLRVWAKKPADANDPCSISADAHYRGLENHLYRVEIHDLKPSFKWSRENGSVTFNVITKNVKPISGKIVLEVETLGPDRRYGLCVNDWVELTSDAIEFGQKVLPLAKVEKIDSNLGRLTLSINTDSETDFMGCSLIRRWDQNPRDNKINEDGTIDIDEDDDDDYDKGIWIPLEQGIKVQFQPGGNYRKGDYWLIPARVATGDVVWPKKKVNGNYVPDARSTDGIKRHRAALGVIIDGKPVESSCADAVTPFR